MKLTTSASEKRSIRTDSDEFISREFSASISRDVPDDTTPMDLQVQSADDNLFVRGHVLRCFVMTQMLTMEQYGEMLQPFMAMKDAATQQALAAKDTP